MSRLTVPAHTTDPGGARARCGATDGVIVPWEQVIDPDYPAHFTCPNCLDHARENASSPGGPR
jgi:hypothetical protein